MISKEIINVIEIPDIEFERYLTLLTGYIGRRAKTVLIFNVTPSIEHRPQLRESPDNILMRHNVQNCDFNIYFFGVSLCGILR